MTPSDRSTEVVRVIVVSPGDVAAERDTVKLVVETSTTESRPRTMRRGDTVGPSVGAVTSLRES